MSSCARCENRQTHVNVAGIVKAFNEENKYDDSCCCADGIPKNREQRRFLLKIWGAGIGIDWLRIIMCIGRGNISRCLRVLNALLLRKEKGLTLWIVRQLRHGREL